ncbi:MAG: phospholipase D-like domain-containing protein [Thermoguttaceae bacterium]
MIPEVIAEDGNDRQHRNRLRRLLETTRGSVRIASAYITENDLLSDIKDRNVRLLTSMLRMDVVSGATSLECLRLLIERGVQCRSLSEGPRLHAKVYMFGDEFAVVTSANLTRNALDSNIEAGAQLTGSAVQELTEWFDALWAKAESLDLDQLFKWQQATAGLRREYAVLRKKASAKPTLPNETLPSVGWRDELRELLDNANRFFLCNTHRRKRGTRTASGGYALEEEMHKRHYAVAWEDFKYPGHMDKVGQSDAILMFAKGVGIIGVGRARAGREILQASDSDKVSRIRNFDYQEKDREWRVPVDWLVWVEDDADACPFPSSPNATFVEVTGDKYSNRRQSVRRRFLCDS